MLQTRLTCISYSQRNMWCHFILPQKHLISYALDAWASSPSVTYAASSSNIRFLITCTWQSERSILTWAAWTKGQSVWLCVLVASAHEQADPRDKNHSKQLSEGHVHVKIVKASILNTAYKFQDVFLRFAIFNNF